MFTGILQGTASVVGLEKTEGLGIVALEFEDEFCTDLQVGASVSVDGVCLTATKILSNRCVSFDVIWQSLYVTTLKNLELWHVYWQTVFRAEQDFKDRVRQR